MLAKYKNSAIKNSALISTLTFITISSHCSSSDFSQRGTHCRYNFYLDNELIDFVENCLWLKRQKNYAQYFNSLIKQDLLKTLGLPADTSNEEMLEKWEEYKKNNNR